MDIYNVDGIKNQNFKGLPSESRPHFLADVKATDDVRIKGVCLNFSMKESGICQYQISKQLRQIGDQSSLYYNRSFFDEVGIVNPISFKLCNK